MFEQKSSLIMQYFKGQEWISRRRSFMVTGPKDIKIPFKYKHHKKLNYLTSDTTKTIGDAKKHKTKLTLL